MQRQHRARSRCCVGRDTPVIGNEARTTAKTANLGPLIIDVPNRLISQSTASIRCIFCPFRPLCQITVVINRAGLYPLACFFVSEFSPIPRVRRQFFPILAANTLPQCLTRNGAVGPRKSRAWAVQAMNPAGPRWFYAKALNLTLFRCASRQCMDSYLQQQGTPRNCFLFGVAISYLHSKPS
jgi:hypothetical protein